MRVAICVSTSLSSASCESSVLVTITHVSQVTLVSILTPCNVVLFRFRSLEEVQCIIFSDQVWRSPLSNHSLLPICCVLDHGSSRRWRL